MFWMHVCDIFRTPETMFICAIVDLAYHKSARWFISLAYSFSLLPGWVGRVISGKSKLHYIQRNYVYGYLCVHYLSVYYYSVSHFLFIYNAFII